MTAPEPAIEADRQGVTWSKYAETLDAVGFVAEIDPVSIKGYVLIVDNGTRQAIVTTDMESPGHVALVARVAEILIGGLS